MFKVIKRTLAIILTIAMAFSVAACGGGNGNGETNGTETGGALSDDALKGLAINSDELIASMPEELKNTKIVFLSWYDPMEREEKPVIEAFEQKTGIDIECRVTDHAGYISTVATMIATNEQLDVMRIKQPSLAAFKLLQPITVMDFDFSGKEWDQYTMGLYTVGEKCYAASLRYTPYFLPTMLFYNKGVIEDMGFEDPYELWKQRKWTWAKFEEMCTTWVNENGSEYRGAYMMDYPHSTMGIGFAEKTEDGITYKLNLTNQDVLDSYKFMSEGAQAGLYDFNYDGFDQAKPKMLFGAMDATAVQQSSGYFPKTRMRGQLAAVAFPYWDLNGYTFEDYHLPMKENVGFGVPKTAKNAKAVPYFLAYMCNLANYNTGIGEGGMFFSEQAKEAYMELMTFEKRAFDVTTSIAGYDGTIESFTWEIVKTVAPAQLNSWLQEREYILKNCVELYNQDKLALK